MLAGAAAVEFGKPSVPQPGRLRPVPRLCNAPTACSHKAASNANRATTLAASTDPRLFQPAHVSVLGVFTTALGGRWILPGAWRRGRTRCPGPGPRDGCDAPLLRAARCAQAMQRKRRQGRKGGSVWSRARAGRGGVPQRVRPVLAQHAARIPGQCGPVASCARVTRNLHGPSAWAYWAACMGLLGPPQGVRLG